MDKCKVVIGANFGDEGKGLITDYFASFEPNTIVVLANGGAQRGHTVVTPEGYRHVFHHFGSGTFVGAATYCADSFLVNPVLFNEEWDKLVKHKIYPRIYINPNCLLTTIYDMLVNQALEADRGATKHGSCGVGIYETLYRAQAQLNFIEKPLTEKYSLTVKEFESLSDIDKLSWLLMIRDTHARTRLANIKSLSPELTQAYNSIYLALNFIDDFNKMISRSSPADNGILLKYKQVIFEMGQGLLLDKNNMDYFPHLTPSSTGLAEPDRILNDIGVVEKTEACFVSRTYVTRHGKGKLPRECDKKELNPNGTMIDLTNVPNPFQDNLRYAWLDTEDLYKQINNEINKYNKFYPTLALTHNDEVPLWNPGYVMPFHLYRSFGITRENVEEENYLFW